MELFTIFSYYFDLYLYVDSFIVNLLGSVLLIISDHMKKAFAKIL